MRKILEAGRNWKSSIHIRVLIAGLLILGTAVIWAIYFKYPPGWDFRNNLYLPAYLLLQHQSPYNIHVLVDGSNAVWLPMVIGIFFPLGYLDLQQSSNLWWLLNFGSLFCLIFISTWQRKPSLTKMILVVLLILMFPSSISHLDLGQISILICLVLVIIIRFEEQLPAWATGLLLAFTLTKPQLVVLFIPAFFFSTLRSRGWRRVLEIGVWTLLGIVILSIPVIISSPNWLNDFIFNLSTNPTWKHPSLYTAGFLPLSKLGQFYGYLFFLTGISISLYLVTRSDKKEMFLWILALITVFSPYIWSWDFVLMYPVMIFTLFSQKNMFTTTLLYSSYLLVLGLYTTQKLTGQMDDSGLWWIPWCLLVITLVVRWLPKKK